MHPPHAPHSSSAQILKYIRPACRGGGGVGGGSAHVCIWFILTPPASGWDASRQIKSISGRKAAMFTAMRSAVAGILNKLHSLPIVKQCPHFFLQLRGPGNGDGRGRGSLSLMCPMIRTPSPPFPQTFNLRGPAADVLFIKRDANGKEEGKKREEKKVHGCYFGSIRFVKR